MKPSRSRSAPVVALLGLLALVALVAARTDEGTDPHDQKPSAEEQARLDLPLARINGQTLTVGDYETSVARQSPLLASELNDPAKRQEFLDKLISFELMAAEAERRGFGKDPEVGSVRKNQLASVMLRHIDETIPATPATDEAIRAYYDSHYDSYHKPEKLRASVILFADAKKAETLLADVQKKKSSQHEFKRLAQENSEDEATRLKGGDLGWFVKPGDKPEEGDPTVDPAIAAAAFAVAENGQVAPKLVKTARGHWVVMRTGHRDKMELSYEEVKSRLGVLVERENHRQAVEKAVETLNQRFPVQLHEENLKDVVIDLSGGPPSPTAPGGMTKREAADRLKGLSAQGGQPELPTAAPKRN